jgi:adenylate cyclase
VADLEARGKDSEHTWRHALPTVERRLGRHATESDWAVPWDRQISKVHALVLWQNGKLHVRKHRNARNQIFYQGKAIDDFTIGPGEQFVIGETVFTVHETEGTVGSDAPEPYEELTISPKELRAMPYADAHERIEALADLPGIIRYSPSDHELETRVLDALLRGIRRASEVGVVWLNPDSPADNPEIQVRASAARGGQATGFKASRRLVYDAIRRRRQGVMHLWAPGNSMTNILKGGDWALCTPLPDDPAPGWALYVIGSFQAEARRPGQPMFQALLKSDLKFVELVAEIFGALRQVRDLQRRQGLMERFLSRPVLAALAQQDMGEVLKPRETEVTVLFCDLRGSCHIAEEGQQDLAEICDRVSEALSIMTSSILDQDGVIGDFQGDAAMGFWGWPLKTADQVERAARAALAVGRGFQRAARQKGNALADFRCGIGIANGPAIAGRLGTIDQAKVSVFGPVVNLAARLESMTKQFGVPILLDEPTAARLIASNTSHWARCRPVARVQPFGMRTVLTVHELMPPAVEPGAMSERDRRDYEAALEAFLASRWDDARQLLHRLPSDGPSKFLSAYMSARQNQPPAEWNGIIGLESK